MRLPLAFGEFGGLPAGQNGVGDPLSLLIQKQIMFGWLLPGHMVWVISGHGGVSHPGMDMNHTAQLVLAKSTDDGKTWSAPINITEQVKDPSWYFLLQGPGRGITMSDGTLVFPTQFIDSTRVPNAGISTVKMVARTGRCTIMHVRTLQKPVAEVEPGVLC